MIIKNLKERLPQESKRRIQSFISDNKVGRILVNLFEYIFSIGSGFNLTRLGEIYRTDKAFEHSYMSHYQLHLRRFKFKRIRLLEIGVGGYKNPQVGGHSLRMWKKYFPFGKIFAIDIYDKSSLQENRIKIFKGSQVDENFLDEVTNAMGRIDVIIDDGSHINEHVIASFKLLFPKLNDGGIYVVEDMQTSYWLSHGGDSEDLNNPKTMMNFFKSLIDSLNNKEFVNANYKQSYYDKKIVSMHFYHNILFIFKGNNYEESSSLINNKFRISDKA